MPGEAGIFASQTHLDQNQLDTAITSSLRELESWLQDKEFRRDGEGLSSICIDPGLQKVTEPLLKRLNLKSVRSLRPSLIHPIVISQAI